jgi:hypothetical protein
MDMVNNPCSESPVIQPIGWQRVAEPVPCYSSAGWLGAGRNQPGAMRLAENATMGKHSMKRNMVKVCLRMTTPF